MVSIWLTKVKSWDKSRAKRKHEKNRPRGARPIFVESCRFPDRLLAILLDAGGAKTRQTMLVDGKLPGEEFVDRQGITAAGLLEGEKSATHSSDDFGLAADDPAFGAGCGQICNRQRTAVRPDDVFYPRAMGFCHGVLTNSQPLNSLPTTYARLLKIYLSQQLQYESPLKCRAKVLSPPHGGAGENRICK